MANLTPGHNYGDFTENSLVEQPAIGLFAELGWKTANCFHEAFGANGTLGRETSAEGRVSEPLITRISGLRR